MKLTQFGRLRRRIKRELDAARKERAWSQLQSAGLIAQSVAQFRLISEAVITVKMLRAWEKEKLGKLPDSPEPEYTAVPIMKKE